MAEQDDPVQCGYLTIEYPKAPNAYHVVTMAEKCKMGKMIDSTSLKSEQRCTELGSTGIRDTNNEVNPTEHSPCIRISSQEYTLLLGFGEQDLCGNLLSEHLWTKSHFKARHMTPPSSAQRHNQSCRIRHKRKLESKASSVLGIGDALRRYNYPELPV